MKLINANDNGYAQAVIDEVKGVLEAVKAYHMRVDKMLPDCQEKDEIAAMVQDVLEVLK